MKKIPLLLLCTVLLLLTGCGGEGGFFGKASRSDPEENEGYRFVFVCPILENEYWEACIEGIQRADSELGTSTQVIGPKTADHFATEIVSYMEDAVAAAPDGIMVYAGIEALFPLIEQATADGIPVLALDSDAPDTSRIAYVGTDTYNAGYTAGETMAELTGGTAKIGILVSSLSAEKEMKELDAFYDALHDYEMEFVAIAETNADPDVAEEATRKMLAEHPEITAMFNTAGYNVTGAARVKKELGLDDLILLGFDDVEENLRYVRDGTIDALFVQRIEQIGYQSVYLMKEYLEKGRLSKTSYDTGLITVTKENVENYSSDQTTNAESKTVRVGYYSGDPAFQDGFDDGARKSGYAYEYYQAIAALAGWQYEYVYGSRAEISELLRLGEIDLMAGVYQTSQWEDQAYFSDLDLGLDGQNRYFAISILRPDLKDDLDYAMEQLLQTSPDFTVTLHQKYYGQATQLTLTKKESDWLKSKGILRIGYVRHNLPFSEQDETGEPTGLIRDLIDAFGDYLRILWHPVCYETVNDLEAGLAAGQIDVAFPIYSDLWLTESKGFRQTDSFLSDRVMVIYSGTYSNDLLERVVLSRTGIGQQYYMATYYPDSEIVYYNSREEALDAIQRGDERCIVGCSSILQRFLAEHPDYKTLNISYLDTSENFSMAVAQGDSLLVGILNKAIRQMDSATITSAMMQYSGVSASYTLNDFLQQYSLPLLSVLLLFFAILLWVFVSYRQKTRLFNQEQSKTRAALERALGEAKVASEAKTTFLSSMSHDIRTPMNAIVGMTAIASKHLGDRARIKDCLDKISLASHHLLTLINDVLDISKIESGKLALNPVDFSLRDMVTTLVNIVRPQLRSKNLQFDVHLFGLEYETVYADEVRINQIFVNLLTNAVKYTPEGGKVVMDLTEELLSDGKTVRLTYKVADTGIGMSKEFMETMYDTFTRAKNSRINRIQGTGLGLAIVRQMVDLLKGTIDCQSEEGKGTTFTVTLDLPLRENAPKQERLPEIRILLVDDDEIFLESATEVLQSMGALPETADRGRLAIEMVKARCESGNAYPIVIVDWKMPDMDGLETIRAIRAIMGDQVPVILVSAYDWSDIEEQAKESGASGFISKPLFRSYIYEKIQEALQLRDAADDAESAPEDDLKGRHLLVAEDNELNWEVTVDLLAMRGITADWAENGRICVEKLTAAPPGTYDLILMDIQMPIMNGREATRLIRRAERDDIRSIPIIALTADAFAEDIAASMEAGMDGHASKPIDMEKLCQEMRNVLHTRKRT